MRTYLDFLKHIMETGTYKDDRTNTGTRSCFGYQMRFDLSKGFPLLTTKRVHMKSIIHELLWFIKGDTNISYLVDNDVRIWNEWPYNDYSKSPDFQGESLEEFVLKIKNDSEFAQKHGNLGPVYGRQWRHFEGPNGYKDQLAWVINEIKTNPNSRRLIVNSWQATEIDKMALPPCHVLFQFYVKDNKLSCQLYQRSADAFLGIPFNIASYSLLTMMIAEVCNLEYGEFVHSIGDAHIYSNHFDQVSLQLEREPRSLPNLTFARKVNSIDDFKYDDIVISDYKPHPTIKAKVAV